MDKAPLNQRTIAITYILFCAAGLYVYWQYVKGAEEKLNSMHREFEEMVAEYQAQVKSKASEQ